MTARFRRFLFVTLFAAIAAVPGAGQANAGPDGFIQNLAQKAIPYLTDSGISAEDRQKRFRELLNEGFEMAVVGRLVLGRYWNRATPEQQSEFLRLLEDYIVQLYAARFGEFAGVDLEVKGVQQQDGRDMVNTLITRPQGPPVRLDWRVEQVDGRMVVTDIVVEGVSMVVTQRSEFASVIRSGGGEIDRLLAMLKDKTAGMTRS